MSTPDRTLASPNTIVSAYFGFARGTAQTLQSRDADSRAPLPVAVAIIMLVGAVEAYLNIIGRMWVEQNPQFPYSTQILDDLDKRRSFTRKLKTWPELLFGKPLDLARGVPQEFLQLVERRNELIHFTTTHESVSHENITMHGLADITFYDSLTPRDLMKAINTAEDTIGELMRLQDGLGEETILLAKTYWTGRPVFPIEVQRARDIDQRNNSVAQNESGPTGIRQ